MKTSLRKLVWLGVLVASTSAIAAVSGDSQVIVDGANNILPHGWRFPTFDAVEDTVDRWVENGRQFINRNGQMCTYPYCNLCWLYGFQHRTPTMRECIDYHNT